MRPKIFLLENIRFFIGEKDNSLELSDAVANTIDAYVFDAFGTAHREQASTHAAIKSASIACAGLLLEREKNFLSKALKSYESPYIAIIGGAKVSSKLELIKHLNSVADHIIVGGGIANTFLKASGLNIGKSLVEDSMIDIAKEIMERGSIVLPVDVVVSSEVNEAAESTIKRVDAVSEEDHILDIGPLSISRNRELVSDAKTIVWNGPLGVFEIPQFSAGTRELGKSIKESKAFSIAGGGDTISAIEISDALDGISYISTGGGAFLETLEGKTLPGVSALLGK